MEALNRSFITPRATTTVTERNLRRSSDIYTDGVDVKNLVRRIFAAQSSCSNQICLLFYSVNKIRATIKESTGIQNFINIYVNLNLFTYLLPALLQSLKILRIVQM